MAGRYAQDTEVAPERSRGEIERILKRYGADAFMYGVDADRAIVGFRAHQRFVRFIVPVPPLGEFAVDGNRRRRSPRQAEAAREKEERRRWRCLALAIKAKLEVVESEIATFEEEFLAHLVLPSGMTFGEWAGPQIAEAYATGDMPAPLQMLALPPGSGER